MFEIDENNLPVVRTRQALIVLDLQNDFCSSGPLLVQNAPALLQNTVKLVKDFRASGTGNVIWIRSLFEASRPVNLHGLSESEGVITDKELLSVERDNDDLKANEEVIPNALESRDGGEEGEDHDGDSEDEIPLEVDEDDVEEADEAEETFLTVMPGRTPQFLLPSSPGTNFAQGLIHEMNGQTDLIFQKTWYSAFKDGTLVQTLRANFVTEIYICGAFTNISIFATAMDAARHGYQITLVEDCLGYRSRAKHDEALRRLEEFTGCEVTNSHEISEDLARRARRAQKVKAAPPNRNRPPRPSDNRLEKLMGKLTLDLDELPTLTPVVKSSGPSKNVAVGEATKQPQISVDDSNESLELKLPARSSEVDGKKRERVKSKIKSRRHRSKSETTRESSLSQNTLVNVESENPSQLTQESIDSQPPTLPEISEPKTSDESKGKAPEVQKSDKSTMAHTQETSESICEGDACVIKNLLNQKFANGIYEKIRDEVRWQKMSHLGGDVPRLVAVQGVIAEDGSYPIYRHPADEMPPLLSFSPMVSLIAKEVQKNLGHPVNHVLIQFYRDGTDHITEHSDKTLDIVPGTFIANVSLGAQRTMVLRTKKLAKGKETTPLEVGERRQIVRAAVPHNSMFKMGLVTNMRWLHGIRPDKRLASEKTVEELAFNCGRISLTFRQIGTFLDKDSTKIWGQGATSKSRESAKNVINGDEHEAEKMIRAFGTENHSTEFDWNAIYGKGFDVLHMENNPKLFLSGDFIPDTRVKILLAEYGIEWVEGKISPHFNWKDGSSGKDAPTIPERLPVKFMDNDLSKSTVTGDMAILLYLDAVYGPKARTTPKSQPDLARQYTRLQLCHELLQKWEAKPFNVKRFRRELEMWAGFCAESKYAAGSEISVVDFALFSIFEHIREQWKNADGLEAIAKWYWLVNDRESVTKVLGDIDERLTSAGKVK